jgi:hypothetical protein
MNSPRTLLRTALPLLLMISAAACGDSSSASHTPTPTPTPSLSAKTFASAKFSTVVPTGWTDMTGNQSAVGSIHAGGQVLMLLLAAQATMLNEHIDVSLASQPVPQDALGGYLQSVSHGGATNLSPLQSFSLDGDTGLFITYNLVPSGGTPLKDEDMVVNHGGDTYDIVLNTAQADFNLQLADLQMILAKWKWKIQPSQAS